MFAEAASAPDAVRRQIAANGAVLDRLCRSLRDDRPPFVLTCARGSSDHVATYLKYLFETQLGLPVASFAPSVESVYRAPLAVRGAVCFLVSQSGRSPDLLAVARRTRASGARVVALVNDAEAPLAAEADFVVPLHAGTERSVAATKSFIAGLFAVLAITHRLAPQSIAQEAIDGLPSALEQAWMLDWSPLVDALAPARSLYTIGRGIGLAVAAEAALKLKETCGLHAEAFSAAEVRHGPMALFGPELPLLLFAQDDAAAPSLMGLAQAAAASGVPVLAAGLSAPQCRALPTIAAPALLQPLLQAQSLYRAANLLSFARGHHPDHPPLLRKVTETL